MRSFRFWLTWIAWSVLAFMTFPVWIWAYGQIVPAGSHGDTYAALAAIFTLFAFVGIVVALHTQRTDADVQNARSEFFQLIGVWQEVVHNTVYNPETGRQAFHKMSHELSAHMNANLLSRSQDAVIAAEDIQKTYAVFYFMGVSEPLGHYFRLLYNIVRFVDEERVLGRAEKERLIRIVRALISEPEFNLLFWNGLSEYGKEKFHPLIDKYDLLQNFLFNGIKDNVLRLYPITFARQNRLRS